MRAPKDWKESGRYPDMAEWIGSTPKVPYSELRTVAAQYWDAGDVWGSTMILWFQVCDVLSMDGYPIPAEWLYRPAPAGPYFGDVPIDLFYALAHAELSDVAKLGTRLARLADKLEEQGRDY